MVSLFVSEAGLVGSHTSLRAQKPCDECSEDIIDILCLERIDEFLNNGPPLFQSDPHGEL